MTLKTILLCLFLTLISPTSNSENTNSDSNNNQTLESYEATFDVIRNGKVMAEQKTSLKTSPLGHYVFSDTTTGTHGLASFTGFERSEVSEFVVRGTGWQVLKHNMNQKVTFSKRAFSFTNNTELSKVEGQHKGKAFTIEYTEQPMASHMLSLRIAELACRQKKSDFDISVLKSKRMSHYTFTAETTAEGTIKASRKYPENSHKNSLLWINPNNKCLVYKSQHSKDDDVIETVLRTFNSKAVAH